MESQQRVFCNVRHVDGFAPPVDLGMFTLHQPADVREEKSSIGIVRVGVCLAEFVMHPVVPDPFRYGVLVPKNKTKHLRYILSLKSRERISIK